MEITFRITALHCTGGDPAELFTDLSRQEALDHVELHPGGGSSIVEGFLGVQLRRSAMHQYQSTDERFTVRIEAVK
jgi:hypothetical protein